MSETNENKEPVAVGSDSNEGLGDDDLITCLWCQCSTPHETAVGACCWEEWQRERIRFRKALEVIANYKPEFVETEPYLRDVALEALGLPGINGEM